LNSDVKVYADVLVKHAVPLGNQDLRLTAKATVERNMADGIIITGDITGEEASVDDLIKLKGEIDKPILVGSGINKDNVSNYLKYCDGVIVGTSLKENNTTNNPVSRENVREFIKIVKNNF
jgi:membrane complex biogenesis BtpA family protein